jgi:hypothetical protein
MGALLSSITGGVWGYVAAAVIAAGLSGYAVHRWDASIIAEMKLAAEQKEMASVTEAVRQQAIRDKAIHDADVSYAESQQKTITVTQEIVRNVPKYITVQDDAACVLPDNFGRLLDAAQLGVDPDTLPAAATKPDGTASVLSLSEATGLLAQILGDYASVRARLVNAREAWEAQNKADSK